jgi:hypothetical protein
MLVSDIDAKNRDRVGETRPEWGRTSDGSCNKIISTSMSVNIAFVASSVEDMA